MSEGPATPPTCPREPVLRCWSRQPDEGGVQEADTELLCVPAPHSRQNGGALGGPARAPRLEARLPAGDVAKPDPRGPQCPVHATEDSPRAGLAGFMAGSWLVPPRQLLILKGKQ